MAKTQNRTTEVLVVKGVNVSALRGQSIKTGRIFNNPKIILFSNI